jgi:hypothetical protein
MIKLLKKLFKREKDEKNTNIETTKTETTTTNSTNTCKKLEFYDRFIIIKNPKDDTIETTVEKIYYEDYEVEELEEKERTTIDLPRCAIEVSLANKENTTDEIAITHIVVRNENVPFKLKIYTTEKLETVITEPQEIEIGRFKLSIKQK